LETYPVYLTIAEYPITPYISIARTMWCGRKQNRRLKTDEKTSIEDEKMCIDEVRTCVVGYRDFALGY
jgi:hypothetical protein